MSMKNNLQKTYFAAADVAGQKEYTPQNEEENHLAEVLAAIDGGRGTENRRTGFTHDELIALGKACPACPDSARKDGAADDPANEAAAQNFISVCAPENFMFIAGTQSILQLAITPLTADLKGLYVWAVPMVGDKLKVLEIPVQEILRPDRTITLELPFCPVPGYSGMFIFHFYFLCVCSSGLHYRMMKSNLYYIASTEDHDTDTLNSAAELLMRHGFPMRQYPLEPTLWRPENFPIQGEPYPATKIALEMNGHTFHILARDTVTFGRTFETNDIVIANHPSAQYAPEAEAVHPNNTVSATHALISLTDDGFALEDRSRYGTLLNHEKIHGETRKTEGNATLEIGDFILEIMVQTCADRHNTPYCRSCPGKRAKALCIRRGDGIPESYLIVPQCCDLGEFMPSLRGIEIIRFANTFALKAGNGRIFYLAPGFDFTCGDMRFRIR